MTGLASPASTTTSATWVASAVQRAVAGDEVAFARIVDAYHGDLVRVAYVVAGDEQLAQDAVQAAWSIAWRKLGSLRDPERLRPWLISVAANEARQLLAAGTAGRSPRSVSGPSTTPRTIRRRRSIASTSWTLSAT
jgi:DNA-directed RNA polymerase specialized sigma24 family protein